MMLIIHDPPFLLTIEQKWHKRLTYQEEDKIIFASNATQNISWPETNILHETLNNIHLFKKNNRLINIC